MSRRLAKLALAVYLAYAAGLACLCWLHPLADNFDRYIYEALIRGHSQTPQEVYPLVKHESPRAEASSVLDSPEHLGQLEPLYAIQPVYLEVVWLLTRLGLPTQQSISLVSAFSLFGMAAILLAWTRSPLCCGVLLLMPGIIRVARLGTPDALSAAVVAAALWLVSRDRLFGAILLLQVSIWIRTDNVLIAIAVLAWLCLARRISPAHTAALCGTAVGSVWFMNTLAGSYGWMVLFRYSFIGGKYPAEIPSRLSPAEYAHAAASGAELLVPALAPWLLLAIVAWQRSSPAKPFLITIVAAVALHFLLFPSPEWRYFVWAYLVTGALFIQSLTREGKTTEDERGRQSEE